MNSQQEKKILSWPPLSLLYGKYSATLETHGLLVPHLCRLCAAQISAKISGHPAFIGIADSFRPIKGPPLLERERHFCNGLLLLMVTDVFTGLQGALKILLNHFFSIVRGSPYNDLDVKFLKEALRTPSHTSSDYNIYAILPQELR